MRTISTCWARILSGERSAGRAARLAGLLWLCIGAGSALAQQSEADSEATTEALRDRLTERVDKPRLDDPYSVEIAGRPLTIGGELEIALEFLHDAPPAEPVGGNGGGERTGNGGDGNRDARAFGMQLLPQIEVDFFYTFGPQLSLFAQLRLAAELDLFGTARHDANKFRAERGEMWLYSENIAGSGLSFEIGRLDFEDGRLWWWDDDLDAMRLTWENDKFEIAATVARELSPRRLGASQIDIEDDGVLRGIVEASWDWAPEHSLELFALVASDRSAQEQPGDLVEPGREDASDARLHWLGARASGAWQTTSHGLLGYWLDVAAVRGSERLLEFGENDDDPGIGVVVASSNQRVRGQALDIGATWIAPTASAPRVTIGFARGSGDDDQGDGIDRAFRQTGLHGNEVGFGGVERFAHYGALLDPELSNLSVTTLGLGMSLLHSSSLDLVFNRYRLGEPAHSLRNAALDLALDGEHRELGQAIDLVLAIEEDPRFQLEARASALRFGQALGERRGRWDWGGYLAFRIAF